MRKRIKSIRAGKRRVVEGFLLFPRILRLPDTGAKEFRWLETTKWTQEYWTSWKGWQDLRWAEEGTEEK